jgi:putative flippase GtrA
MDASARPLVQNVVPPEPAAVVEIVIPVYNEAGDLAASVHRLHDYLAGNFPLAWLITIADNASTDETLAIARGLESELDCVHVLHLDQKGRGRALRTAWLASAAPVVAYMDVDLSTDLDALLPLVAPLVSGHSDVAIGSRLASGARVVRGPKREVISRSYNLILKTMLRSGFSDAQCGFKAVRTDVARALLPNVEDNGWFFDTELLVLAERNGLRIHEVPVDWVDDPDSRVDVVSTARADLRGVWRMFGRPTHGQVALNRRASAATNPEAPAPSVGAQVARFASIGIVSTIVFGAMFLLLADRLGVWAADVIALAVCSIANTAANRRLTFALRGRVDRARHYASALALAALPLALNLIVLAVAAGLDVRSRVTLLIALTVANAVATVVRFVLLRDWVFSPAARSATAD